MRSNSNQRKKHIKKFIGITLTVGLLLFSLAVSAVAVMVEPYAGMIMDMSLLKTAYTGEPATLYARSTATGAYVPVEQVMDSPVSFVFAPYRDMPSHLVNAFIAIEDKRFFEHQGVDLLRTARAAVSYLQGGGRSFGGSTITQQLVKNLTGRDDYTPHRKLSEIFLALDTERYAHKTEILECYLNVVNLAGGCRGVGSAANYYFHKSVGELTVAESACLAAIINNPSVYDPVSHPENNQRRREVILAEMRAQGYIDEETYRGALIEAVHPTPEPKRMTVSSWYADMVAADVIHDLQTQKGYSYARAARDVYGGGLRIYTAMDPTLQAIVENYYAKSENFPVGKNGRPQSAMVIINPDTGDILAAAGAVGQKQGNRVQNYATQTKRPSGSVIKPLSVYAPALEQGRIMWSTRLDDVPKKTVNGRDWPRNADGIYGGQVTVGEALTHSLNTVAVELAEEMGVKESFRFLKEELGMNSLQAANGKALNDETLASVALGQQSGGVTVRELTAAYTVFSDGIYRSPVSYRRVEDAEGRVLLENAPMGHAVLSAANACIMTQMLHRVVTEGTARSLTMEDTMGIEAAGKTGTTGDNCDRWFVGYTPRLLAGVWMGYDYPTELKGIKGNPCLKVWDEVLQACEKVYDGAPPKATFDIHPDVIRLSYCRHTGDLPARTCTANGQWDAVEDGWFIRGQEPHGFCDGQHTEE